MLAADPSMEAECGRGRPSGVEDVCVVSQDGSPHGPQRFVLWNPPLTAPNHALAVANGVQMSRTEGRARKGERK